jgi:hypothetical protein
MQQRIKYEKFLSSKDMNQTGNMKKNVKQLPGPDPATLLCSGPASFRTRPLRIRTLWYFTPNMPQA